MGKTTRTRRKARRTGTRTGQTGFEVPLRAMRREQNEAGIRPTHPQDPFRAAPRPRWLSKNTASLRFNSDWVSRGSMRTSSTWGNARLGWRSTTPPQIKMQTCTIFSRGPRRRAPFAPRHPQTPLASMGEKLNYRQRISPSKPSRAPYSGKITDRVIRGRNSGAVQERVAQKLEERHAS